MKRSSNLVLTSVLVSILCGSHLAAQTVRDSAGIRIVTHASAARPQGVWRIAPKPILEIGC